MEFYRTVIRNTKGELELIVQQSKDFGKCLEEARRLLGAGISHNQIDVLALNDAGEWVSMQGATESEVAP